MFEIRICPGCKGKGKIRCPLCNGRGMLPKRDNMLETMTCNACDGVGEILCKLCGGVGKVRDSQDQDQSNSPPIRLW